jgi:hypothetical protein
MTGEERKLQNGDQLFQRNNFNILDSNTWMSPIVYFGINFWNWILKRPIVPANHCGTLYQELGVWYVYEAKIKFVKTPLTSKTENKDITKLTVKRYNLTEEQKEIMYKKALSLLGTDYDFWSIIKQFFRQLFNKKIDLETNPSKFKNKSVNCSEGNAEQLLEAGFWFNNTKSVSPAELWNDDRSFIVGVLK